MIAAGLLVCASSINLTYAKGTMPLALCPETTKGEVFELETLTNSRHGSSSGEFQYSVVLLNPTLGTSLRSSGR
jgi:hypothetical protein